MQGCRGVSGYLELLLVDLRLPRQPNIPKGKKLGSISVLAVLLYCFHFIVIDTYTDLKFLTRARL